MSQKQAPPIEYDNPLLQGTQYKRPDWRFIVAQSSPTDTHTDKYVDRLLKCYYNGTWKDDPEIDAVVRLKNDYDLNIAAMIVGGAEDEIIARCVGTIPNVIYLYRKLCFDLQPNDPVFKKERAATEYSSSPKERKALQFALVNGWDTYLRTCGLAGKELCQSLSKLNEEKLKEKAIGIANQKLAEQEIAPINSPQYSDNSLLRSIMTSSTANNTEEDENDLKKDLKELVKSLRTDDSRNRIEVNNPKQRNSEEDYSNE